MSYFTQSRGQQHTDDTFSKHMCDLLKVIYKDKKGNEYNTFYWLHNIVGKQFMQKLTGLQQNKTM